MTITIEAMKIDCRVPEQVGADLSLAERSLAKVLDAVRTRLPGTLGSMLASADRSDEIAFIDTVQFDVAVGADWSLDEIARAIAAQLARAIWDARADPSTTRFADSTELLARFLLDVAAGASFSQSWHSRFEGLRLLSESALLRTLGSEEPVRFIAALARLTDANLQALLVKLSEHDAQRLIDTIVLVSGRGCRDVEQIAEAVVRVSRAPTSNSRRALGLVAVLAREFNTGADASTIALAELIGVLAAPNPVVGFSERIERIARGQFAEIDTWLDTLDAPCRHACLSVNADRLASAVARVVEGGDAAHAYEYESPHAGLLLLIEQLFSILEPIDDSAVRSNVAFAVLAACAGSDAQAIVSDSALRNLFGVPPDAQRLSTALVAAVPCMLEYEADPIDTPRSLDLRRRDVRFLLDGCKAISNVKAVRRALVRAAYRTIVAWSRKIPGFADASAGYLWNNFCKTHGSIRMSELSVTVHLAPPALDVMLKISGAGRRRATMPDGRVITVEVRR